MDKKAIKWHYIKLSGVTIGSVAIFLLVVQFGVGLLVNNQPLVESRLFWESFVVIIFIGWPFSYYWLRSFYTSGRLIELDTKFDQGSWLSRRSRPVFDESVDSNLKNKN